MVLIARKINADQYAKDWLRHYEAGWSARKIATEYQVSHGTVRRVLTKYRELRTPLAKQEEIKEQVYQLYLTGLNRNEIAKRLGLSHNRVTAILTRDFQVDLSIKRKFEHLAEAFAADYQQGLSLRNISDRYHVSCETVLKYLNIDGEQVRPLKEANRLYPINEHYFDTLNEHRLYQLGLIWALGHRVDGYQGSNLRLNIKQEHEGLIVEALAGISPNLEDRLILDEVDDIVSIQLSSDRLCAIMKRMGHPCQIPTQWSFKEQFFFWNGYLKGAGSFHTRDVLLYLSFPSESLRATFLTYLKEIGLNHALSRPANPSNGLYLEHKSLLVPLLQHFPGVRGRLPRTLPNAAWQTFQQKYPFLWES